MGERVDSTGDSEENKSGSAGERESSSTERSKEYETESEEDYEALSEVEVHCSTDWHDTSCSIVVGHWEIASS